MHLLKVFAEWGRYRSGEITWQTLKGRCTYRRSQILQHLQTSHLLGQEKFTRFCTGIMSYYDRLWTFLRVPGMDPTNNLAERDLRSVVMWRRISLGTQSDGGSEYVSRIKTAVTTLRKQKRNVLEFLGDLVKGKRNLSLVPA